MPARSGSAPWRGWSAWIRLSGTRDRVITLDPLVLRGWPMQALVAAPDGAIWYGCATGLYRIGPRGGVEHMRPPLAVRSLLRDHRGQLWIGSAEGLYRLASDGHSLLKAWPAGDQAAEVRALVEAPDHRLWLSLGSQGVARFDPATGQTLSVERAARPDGRPARRWHQRADGRSRRHAVAGRAISWRLRYRSARHPLPLCDRTGPSPRS